MMESHGTSIHIGKKEVTVTVLILNIVIISHIAVFETLNFVTTSNNNLIIR